MRIRSGRSVDGIPTLPLRGRTTGVRLTASALGHSELPLMQNLARSAAAFTLAAIAGHPASADFMKVDVQVSASGSDWSDALNVSPGTDVSVRLLVSAGREAGMIAWAGCTLLQLNVSGSGADDAVSGFWGRLQPPTQTFALWEPGTPNARIDRLDEPSRSIQCAQLPPSNSGSTENPIVVFSFTYRVGSSPAFRDTVLDAPATFMTSASVFITEGGSTSQLAASGRVIDPAVIHVTPAPGAALPLASVPLLSRRQRRGTGARLAPTPSRAARRS